MFFVYFADGYAVILVSGNNAATICLDGRMIDNEISDHKL